MSQKSKIVYNRANKPLELRYDRTLFFTKNDNELAEFYGLKRVTFAKARKRLGIKPYKQIQEDNLLQYLRDKVKKGVLSVSLSNIRKEFTYNILKNHILRIIQNNELPIHFEEFPLGYKFPHSSRGYRNFGCRCDKCTNDNFTVHKLRQIRLAREENRKET